MFTLSLSIHNVQRERHTQSAIDTTHIEQQRDMNQQQHHNIYKI